MQVVRLCREHRLYGALIYLFNQGLNDFRTPLEELLSVVQNANRKDAASTWYVTFGSLMLL
jgi:vacuolar protein sorting-associated protein 8